MMSPERKKEVQKKYRNSPKGKARTAAYNEATKEKRRKYSREYTAAHKEEYLARAAKWVEDNPERDKENKLAYRERRRELKRQKIIKEGGCCICGLQYNGENACVFDLHHINPKDKVQTVGNCRGIRQAEREAKKCEVVCSNCHRMIHRRD